MYDNMYAVAGVLFHDEGNEYACFLMEIILAPQSELHKNCSALHELSTAGSRQLPSLHTDCSWKPFGENPLNPCSLSLPDTLSLMTLFFSIPLTPIPIPSHLFHLPTFPTRVTIHTFLLILP